MKLSVQEFRLFVNNVQSESIKGFSDIAVSKEGFTCNITRNYMVQGIVENGDFGEYTYRVSALGQAIANTVCNPDIWLRLESENAGFIRRVYIKSNMLLYMDEMNDELFFSYVPTKEILLGAVLSYLPEQFKGYKCIIVGEGKRLLKIEIVEAQTVVEKEKRKMQYESDIVIITKEIIQFLFERE